MSRNATAPTFAKRPTFSTSGSTQVRAASPFWKHAAILCGFPADVYLEGGDQYRGWFNSSLMCGIAAHDRRRTNRSSRTAGSSTAKANKQSKSIGNVTAPQEIIDKSGAEILRLWAAAVDYTEDVRCSDEILSRVVDAYRKFRNTLRYALGNLDGFDPETDSVAAERNARDRPLGTRESRRCHRKSDRRLRGVSIFRPRITRSTTSAR